MHFFPGSAEFHQDFCATPHASSRTPGLSECVASRYTHEQLVLQHHLVARRRSNDKGEGSDGFGAEGLARTSPAIDRPRHVTLLRREQERGPRPWANATQGATPACEVGVGEARAERGVPSWAALASSCLQG